MRASLSIFRANDIRGIYGKDFDISFCKPLAKSIAFLLKEKLSISEPKILIGFDARLSSPELSKSLIENLQKKGVSTCCIDIVPSPLCYFLLHHYNLSATIVITASHNPIEYNGFKFLVHKDFKTPESISLLKKIYQEENFLKPCLKKGSSFDIDFISPYISSLQNEFSLKPLPFVVDSGNGAIGPLAKKVFTALNLTPELLFTEPNGLFPNHHPDPTIEKNLSVLKKRVKESSAKFGVGFDGDGDRLVLVTKNGRTVLTDEFASLFLPAFFKKQNHDSQKPVILADVKCSDWFFNSIEQAGGEAVMSQSGHSLIRREMEKRNALAAFDFSGHIFFNDRKNRGFDDALYACLRVLELLNNGDALEDLLPKITTARTGEVRLALADKDVILALEKMKLYLQDRKENFTTIDGLRLSRKTSWALFRSSKTQNALTMRFEASNEKELSKLKNEMSSVLKLSFD